MTVSMLMFERRADTAFEVRRVMWHEVRQIGVLRVAPSWLDRIQLRRIGRQPLDIDVPERDAASRLAAERCAGQRSQQMIIGRLQ